MAASRCTTSPSREIQTLQKTRRRAEGGFGGPAAWSRTDGRLGCCVFRGIEQLLALIGTKAADNPEKAMRTLKPGDCSVTGAHCPSGTLLRRHCER